MKVDITVEVPDGKYCDGCMFQALDGSETPICVFDMNEELKTECCTCSNETCVGCSFAVTGYIKISKCPAKSEEAQAAQKAEVGEKLDWSDIK